MRVVLGFPKSDGHDALAPTLSSAEHLGLGYLAASLRAHGHEVVIINAEIEQLDSDEMTHRILEHEPQIVGISPVSASISSALRILKDIKQVDRATLTVLGGHLATMAAVEIIGRESMVDVILSGDAEESLVALATLPLGVRDFSTIPGAVWRDALGPGCLSI